MKILPVTKTNDTNFQMKFKLSDETLKAISTSTRLSVEELHRLPMDEAAKLMRERGALKEQNKLFQWFADKYKAFGEKTGLLKKSYNFYTDVD